MRLLWRGGQRGQPDPKIRDQIVDVALENHLMSQFTSFVAVEQLVVNIGGRNRRVDVPVEMPEGVSYAGVFGESGQPVGSPIAVAGGGGGAINLGLIPVTSGVFNGPVTGSYSAGEDHNGALLENGTRYNYPLGASAASAPPTPTTAAAAPGAGKSYGGGGYPGAYGGGGGYPGGGFAGGYPSGGGFAGYPGVSAYPGASAYPGGGGANATRSLPTTDARTPQQPGGANLSAEDQAVLDGTPAGLKRLDALSPEDRKQLLENLKLAPALRGLVGRLNRKGSLHEPGAPEVDRGDVIIQVWVNSMPADARRQLAALGFRLSAELIEGKVLLGTVHVQTLDDLLALPFVRKLDPPRLDA